MKKSLIIFSIALVSFGAVAQHDHGHHGKAKETQQEAGPMFKNKELGIAYNKYIDLKDALVSSNSIEAQNASAHLLLALQKVKNGDAAYTAAKSFTEQSTLEDQRTAFVDLSNKMLELIKQGKLANGQIYLDYCPMANDNTGAYWLSSEAAIANPYYGKMMLTCGSVKETIN